MGAPDCQRCYSSRYYQSSIASFPIENDPNNGEVGCSSRDHEGECSRSLSHRTQSPTNKVAFVIQPSRHGLRPLFPEMPDLLFRVLFSDFTRTEPNGKDDDDWQASFRMIIQHNLEGLALRFQRDRSGIPPAMLKELQTSHFEKISHTLNMTQRSISGLRTLRDAQIEYVITKGLAIANLNKSVGDRPFTDIDVIVRPEDFTESMRLLRRAGFSENAATQPPRDLFARYCREATNLRDPEGASIDLHHRIPPWLWSGGVTFDVLCRDSRPYHHLDFDFPLASPAHNLLIAALHIFSDQGRPGNSLRVWHDVVLLLNRCSTDDILRCAGETRLDGWLHWIVGSLPEGLCPLRLLDALGRRPHPIPNRLRLQLALTPSIERRPGLEQCLRLPSAHWILFISSMLVPQYSYVRFRYPHVQRPYWHWWKGAVTGWLSPKDSLE